MNRKETEKAISDSNAEAIEMERRRLAYPYAKEIREERVASLKAAAEERFTADKHSLVKRIIHFIGRRSS